MLKTKQHLHARKIHEEDRMTQAELRRSTLRQFKVLSIAVVALITYHETGLGLFLGVAVTATAYYYIVLVDSWPWHHKKSEMP